jgi:hypothetical protein
LNTFSERHGFAPGDAEIVTREAPPELRSAVVDIAYEARLLPSDVRRIACATLFLRPDPSNWSERPNIDLEVRQIMEDAAWYDVYDVIESIAKTLPSGYLPSPLSGELEPMGYTRFEERLNKFFRRRGIGWQLVKHQVEYRGPEAIEVALQGVHELMQLSGRPTAANELHEATRDLGRRPSPEITGAIQHAMAALECVARDYASSGDTLGDVIKRNRSLFPAPLDVLIEKAWGYTSNRGRHILEGQPPTFEEAELIVGFSAVICRYLARKPLVTD